MKLFNKPSWLRPEINELNYWIHLLILATVVLGLLQFIYGGDMFSWLRVIISVPLLAAGDVVAHTVLGLD